MTCPESEIYKPDYEVVLSNQVKMKFRIITPCPDGVMMGTRSYLPSEEDENPRHRMLIKAPYIMGVHAVTEEQFDLFEKEVGATHRKRLLANVNNHNTPATYVRWLSAVEFCEWMNKKCSDPRYTFTLPTEAEWEYACRAGTNTEYFGGDGEESLSEYAHYRSPSKRVRMPQEVGLKKPNSYGLYDMLGNVHEWCVNRYFRNSYRLQVDGAEDEYVLPKKLNLDYNEEHVIRGGAYDHKAIFCRCHSREA